MAMLALAAAVLLRAAAQAAEYLEAVAVALAAAAADQARLNRRVVGESIPASAAGGLIATEKDRLPSAVVVLS